MKPTCAGIALSRIADQAPIFCTTGDHTNLESFGPAQEYKLEGDSLFDINKTLKSLDPQQCFRHFALSYPIYLSDEKRKDLYKTHLHTHDHCTAFLNGCHFGVGESRGDVDCLFLDLTPGQVAASLVRGEISGGQWSFSSENQVALTVLGAVGDLTVQDIVDKLVLPTTTNSATLQCVGILKPEDTFPNISTFELESRFPGIPVKWLSVADLSYGSAVWMCRRRKFYEEIQHASPLTLGVKLADGEIVTVIPEHSRLPATRQFYFTTSKDNQTSASLQFFRGTVPCGKVTLEGLVPRSRGTARIKLSVEWVLCRTTWVSCDSTTIEVEELGSAVRAKGDLGAIDWVDVQKNKGYEEGDKQLAPIFGRDGVIGALPE
ncbi:hypothetical protein CPB86DRAFT_238277 [Serendipita vermifera]|nr:hypothetical protein CPB86DRAFT_238277 [Serendipita vermifera]